VVEVRAKLLYQVELTRSSVEQMWGFSVEAELVENADRQDELCCYVSRVEERSVAMNNGKKKHLIASSASSVCFLCTSRYGKVWLVHYFCIWLVDLPVFHISIQCCWSAWDSMQ